MRTETLRVFLQSLILEAVPSAYYEEAPDSSVFPYAVWQIDWTYTTDARADGILEVNLWDRSKSGSQIDTLADKLSAILDRLSSLEGCFHISIHNMRRQSVSDPNQELRRRRLQFSVFYSEGG